MCGFWCFVLVNINVYLVFGCYCFVCFCEIDLIFIGSDGIIRSFGFLVENIDVKWLIVNGVERGELLLLSWKIICLFLLLFIGGFVFYGKFNFMGLWGVYIIYFGYYIGGRIILILVINMCLWYYLILFIIGKFFVEIVCEFFVFVEGMYYLISIIIGYCFVFFGVGLVFFSGDIYFI